MTAKIRSLVFATDIDVLGPDKLVVRRPGFWRIESPRDRTFWWGNFLLFDDPPRAGDGNGWPEIFREEFRHAPEVVHQTFAWDRVDGESGVALAEFPAPYSLERVSGLIARPEQIRSHPRASQEVTVAALDPDPGGADAQLWQQVQALQTEQLSQARFAEGLPEAHLGGHVGARLRVLREMFVAGRGAWYVALLDGRVVGSLGIVVTAGRARYQAVDTAAAHRGRGIATRLVVEAAELAGAEQQIDHFVMAADPEYHAIRIYESVGFTRAETACGVQLRPNDR